jgi:hypothetical protein
VTRRRLGVVAASLVGVLAMAVGLRARPLAHARGSDAGETP